MSLRKFNLTRMAVLCVVIGVMMTLLIVPSAFAAAGDPLVLNGAYVGPLDATTATRPVATTSVYGNSTFALWFNKNVTTETWWAANVAALSLRDSSGTVVASTIGRIGTGGSGDLYKQWITLAPNANLVIGQTYTICVNDGAVITSNSGEVLTGPAVLATFTVSAPPGQTVVTNHITVDSFLTVLFGKADLLYAVSSLTDTPSDSTTVGVQSNDPWTRTVSWGDLLGVDHGETITAGHLGGLSNPNGALTAAGPNTYTGGPTLDYSETLTFTYNGAGSNPRADTYTGTITIAVSPAI